MKKELKIILLILLLLVTFSSCKKDVDKKTVNTVAQPKGLSWVVEPCIEAEEISVLVSPVFNENTNHYDINFNKLFKIKSNGKYGLIDLYGGMILIPEYDDIFAVRNGDDFIGMKGKLQTYIHSDTLETEPAYRTYNTTKYEYYYNTADNKLIFAKNTSGSISKYETKICMPEVVTGVKNSDFEADGTFGLYASDRVVSGMLYSDAGYYNDGIVAFKKDGKWGYVDSQGKTIIPFSYDAVKGYNAFSGNDTPYESNEGYVAVCRNGKFAFFTSDGEQVCDFIYDNATPCVDNRAFVLVDGKWGIVALNESNTVISKITTTTQEYTTVTTVQTTTATTDFTGNAEINMKKEYEVDTDTLYLRDEIGSDYIITALDIGDIVVCDKITDGWAHLVFDEYDGWVKLEYLKEVD